jgi:hypothetical protein
MMDDQLVEIDTRTLRGGAPLSLKPRARRARSTAAPWPDAHAGHDMQRPWRPLRHRPGQMGERTLGMPGHEMDVERAAPRRGRSRRPTARGVRGLQQGRRDRGDRSRQWTVTGACPRGAAPTTSPSPRWQARLVATLKQGAMVRDLRSRTHERREVFRETNSTTVAHGVADQPDSRYAFVSSEGVGAAPGQGRTSTTSRARREGGHVDVGSRPAASPSGS